MSKALIRERSHDFHLDPKVRVRVDAFRRLVADTVSKAMPFSIEILTSTAFRTLANESDRSLYL